MTFWYWSGYADPYLWLTDPDPDPGIFVRDFPTCFAYYFLKQNFQNFSKIKSRKEVTKQQDPYLVLMVLDPQNCSKLIVDQLGQRKLASANSWKWLFVQKIRNIRKFPLFCKTLLVCEPDLITDNSSCEKISNIDSSDITYCGSINANGGLIFFIVIFHFSMGSAAMNAPRLCKLHKNCLARIGQGTTVFVRLFQL